MIEVRCLHHLAEAEPFRQAINALNLASSRPDPFSTFEFYDNYLRNAEQYPVNECMRLWLLLAFNGEELVGYLALKQCTHRILGLRAVKLDLLTAYAANRPHLVTQPERAPAISAAIYTYLLSRKREWSLLEFQQQDAASALLPPPTEAVSGSCRLQSWPNLAHWSITLRSHSVADYFASLSKKFRSNVSRQMRSLMAAGAVQVLTSSDPQTVAVLFTLYRSIEPHSWKSHAGSDLCLTRRPSAYYRGLMSASQPMRIVIQVLLLDGVPVAGLICGSFDKGLYALDIVYDERFAELAPGSAILLLGMRQAIEGGFEFFDLLRGFGYYKARWQATMTETETLQIYRVGTPYFWRRMLGDLQRRWFSKAAVVDDVLFNPARRQADETDPSPARAIPVDADAQEHTNAAALIAEVLRGRGEFLSATQLAALLPFVTRTAADNHASCS